MRASHSCHRAGDGYNMDRWQVCLLYCTYGLVLMENTGINTFLTPSRNYSSGHNKIKVRQLKSLSQMVAHSRWQEVSELCWVLFMLPNGLGWAFFSEEWNQCKWRFLGEPRGSYRRHTLARCQVTLTWRSLAMIYAQKAPHLVVIQRSWICTDVCSLLCLFIEWLGPFQCWTRSHLTLWTLNSWPSGFFSWHWRLVIVRRLCTSGVGSFRSACFLLGVRILGHNTCPLGVGWLRTHVTGCVNKCVSLRGFG